MHRARPSDDCNRTVVSYRMNSPALCRPVRTATNHPFRRHCLGAAGALLLSLPAGCASDAGSRLASAEPVPHAHIICADVDGRPACSNGAGAGAFDVWIKNAIYHPGATFNVWLAGRTRQSARRLFTARIPDSWGARVLEAKAAFIRSARRELLELEPGRAFADGGESERPRPGRHFIQIFAPEIAPLRIELSSRGDRDLGRPADTSVVCDRSSSGRNLTCTEAALQKAYDFWMDRSLRRGRGRFTVYLVGSSRDMTERPFTASVPDTSPGEQAVSLVAARTELEGILERVQDPNASGIIEALHVAAAELADEPREAVLIIMSDLRQYTPGVWNFERSVPAPDSFARWIDQHHLRPNLEGVSVVVCGYHHLRAPGARPFDGALAARVRDTWQAILTDFGARELRILAACDDATL